MLASADNLLAWPASLCEIRSRAPVAMGRTYSLPSDKTLRTEKTQVTLDAPIIESWERCRRQWAFSQDWELVRVTPMGTLYRALQNALTRPEPDPAAAKAFVMTEAGERGVWTEVRDPYATMVHYAHLAEVLARVLRQPNSEPLKLHSPMKIGDHEWQPASYVMDGGIRLMRVVLADHWDDARQLAEIHSWRTVGDICATGLPMTLRVLVIGSQRDGRRHSFWSKGQRHPVNKQLRFARKHGKADGLSASWETVWREDCDISAQTWLEQMARDGIWKELAFDRKVAAPSKLQRERVLDDIRRIAEEMDVIHPSGHMIYPGKPWLYPMTRSACDDPIRGSCPFQCCCYSPGEAEVLPGDTGVFRPCGMKNPTKHIIL